MLGPQDAIGVVEAHCPQTVVRLQPATNRARIRADIGRIATGGGTDILPRSPRRTSSWRGGPLASSTRSSSPTAPLRGTGSPTSPAPCAPKA